MPEEKKADSWERRNNIRNRSEAVRYICYIYEYIENGDIEVSEKAKEAAELLIQELSNALCTFVKDDKTK